MKPGMQRDILIALRLLFDEFIIEDEEVDAAVRAAKAASQKAPPDDKSK